MFKRWNEIAPISIRLIYGGGLMYHGYPKIFTADGYANIVHVVQGIPAPFPHLVGALIGALEFFGGLALVIGAFVGTFATLFILELLSNVLMQLIRGGAPPPLNPNQPLPGYENTMLYIVGCIALLIGGAGGYSVTRMFNPAPSD
jgi:putative oxidoreductase